MISYFANNDNSPAVGLLPPPQNLQGQVDNLTEQLKKYKRSLKAYAKKIKESGGKY